MGWEGKKYDEGRGGPPLYTPIPGQGGGDWKDFVRTAFGGQNPVHMVSNTEDGGQDLPTLLCAVPPEPSTVPGSEQGHTRGHDVVSTRRWPGSCELLLP